MQVMKTTQEESYNLLKILAIFMVLASHMMNVVELVPPGDMHALQLHNAVRAFLLTSNGLFFMLSGRFLLSRFDGKILDFYWKRLVKIGIPVAAASLFYYSISRKWEGMGLACVKDFLKTFLQSHIEGYFWFVYALAGFYLAVPFLARMFRNMSREEKRALTGISVAFFFLQNLYQIFQMEMVFTAYPFYSWVFYCMLGYLVDSMELTDKTKKLLMSGGVVAWGVSVWEVCFWTKTNPAIYNYSVSMIAMTTAVYLAVTGWGKKLAERFHVPVHFIAQRSFYIYLMHGLTQKIVGEVLAWKLGVVWKGWGCWLLLSLISFILALGIGCILDWIYQPIARRLLTNAVFVPGGKR